MGQIQFTDLGRPPGHLGKQTESRGYGDPPEGVGNDEPQDLRRDDL